MGLIERLFSRGIERRGDHYVVRYEDDTGLHERVFRSRPEARAFRATLGLAGSRGAFGRGPVGDHDGKFGVPSPPGGQRRR